MCKETGRKSILVVALSLINKRGMNLLKKFSDCIPNTKSNKLGVLDHIYAQSNQLTRRMEMHVGLL